MASEALKTEAICVLMCSRVIKVSDFGAEVNLRLCGKKQPRPLKPQQFELKFDIALSTEIYRAIALLL